MGKLIARLRAWSQTKTIWHQDTDEFLNTSKALVQARIRRDMRCERPQDLWLLSTKDGLALTAAEQAQVQQWLDQRRRPNPKDV